MQPPIDSLAPTSVEPDEGYDLVVCGGGLAGVCAAVAAARLGTSVALVQDRPVLGGNSSSEVRVVPRGSTTYHAWAREGGVLREAMAGERARNHEPIFENGWTNSVWDLELYDIAQRTANLTLHLNTQVMTVERAGRSITAIGTYTPSAERSRRIEGRVFLDATGDGIVADRAGCEIRYGTEPRSEFDEPHALEQGSADTMGNSLHFKTKDVGHPVEFQLPEWAHEYHDADFFYTGGRRPHDLRGGFWWIELGTPWHTIDDAETLRHELTRHTLGVWDWMKNKDPQLRDKVANLALDWIGQVPGKRESRRVVGLHLMTEHDLLAETPPPDEIAYGGWNIDLHTPGGLLADTSEPTAAEGYVLTGTASTRAYVGPFGIPLRSLIAKDVDNLLMAGRNVSATHVALGSIRVQSTTAMMGQAAGTAAAISLRYAVPLHELATTRVEQVQQQLLRDGCFLTGVENRDPDDRARAARVTGSSSALSDGAGPDDRPPAAIPGDDRGLAGEELTQLRAQWVPVACGPDAPGVTSLSVLLRNRRDAPAVVSTAVRLVAHVWDYRTDAGDLLSTGEVTVGPGEHWVEVPLETDLRAGEDVVRYLRVDVGATEGVDWPHAGRVLPGAVAAFEMTPGRMRRFGDGVTMSHRVAPAQPVHPATAAITGAARPHRAPNLWLSDPEDTSPELLLEWDAPIEVSELHLTFPGHLLREYDRTPPLWRDPEVCADYRIRVRTGDDWQELLHVTDNVQPRRVHQFNRRSGVSAIQLEFLRTHGNPSVGLHEVRVY